MCKCNCDWVYVYLRVRCIVASAALRVVDVRKRHGAVADPILLRIMLSADLVSLRARQMC